MELSDGGYYDKTRQLIPTALLDSMSRSSTIQFGMRNPKARPFSRPMLRLSALHLLPRLAPADPCCQVFRDRQMPTAAETSYVVEFTLYDLDSENSYIFRAKYDVKPNTQCYGKV